MEQAMGINRGHLRGTDVPVASQDDIFALLVMVVRRTSVWSIEVGPRKSCHEEHKTDGGPMEQAMGITRRHLRGTNAPVASQDVIFALLVMVVRRTSVWSIVGPRKSCHEKRV